MYLMTIGLNEGVMYFVGMIISPYATKSDIMIRIIIFRIEK